MKKITSYRIRGKIKKWTMLFGMSLLFSFSAFSQTNIAPLATITANGTGAPGCQTGACSTLNDLNYGTCGTQQMWINTATPPSTTVGDDWIQWDFPSAKTFDSLIIFHANSTSRSLTGALVQHWDGTAWVNHTTFSNLPQQCVNRVHIGKLTTDRFRITVFEMNGTGQLSNPNFREIEIIEAPSGTNDAAVLSVDSPGVYCGGVQTVAATIGNLGINQIDSVDVHWEVNGVAQPSLTYVGLLDTILGTNSYSVQLILGTFTFPAGLNEIKVYTSNPNSAIDTVNANDTVYYYTGPALAGGTYTIDQNQPTGGTNYSSFGDLEAELNQVGICGPVLVNVSPGVYNEDFHLDNVSGLSAINTLTIDGQDSANAILRNDGSHGYSTITLEDVSHVTIRNLGIHNTGSGTAVLLNNADYNTIANCESKVDASSTSSLVSNIVVSSSSTGLSSGGSANYNRIENNLMIGGYYGFYFYGSTNDLGVYNQIVNNDLDSAYYYGIYSYYQDSLEFVGNRINMLSRGNVNADGGYMYYSNNTKFSKNYIWAGDYGVYFYNLNTYAPIRRRFEVSNNMIYSASDYGVYMYYVDSVDFWHNSIHVEGTTTPALQINSTTSAPIGAYDVRNNILSSLSTEALETNEPDTIFDKLNNNVYYTQSGHVLNIDGTGYATLAAYQLAQPLFNTASLEGDPQFLSNTDFHIIGAFVNDGGDNSVNITEDIDGDVRPMPGATIVDIGADEFDPPSCPPPFNMGAFNPSLDSVTIFWTGNFGVSTYEYEVVPCGSGQGSGTTVVTGLDSLRIGGLTASSCYELYVREICNRGDTSFWVGPTSFNTANGIPYFQDFERWPNNLTGLINEEGWYTNGTPTPHWEIGQSTSSGSTGPSEDHTIGAGGTFVYLETSGGGLGDDDTLYSPPIYVDPAYNAIEFQFWYHMHGATMADLEVYVRSIGILNPVFSISGQQHPVQTDPWLSFDTLLAGYAGQSIQLLFVGTRGSSFTGDMAIDDVKLDVVAPVDGSIVGLDEPINDSLQCYTATENVSVELFNAGSQALDFTVDTADVTVNVSGATTQSLSFTVNDNTLNGGVALGSGQSISVPMGTIDMTAVGAYYFDATVSISADGVAANNSYQDTIVTLAQSGGSLAMNDDSLCLGDSATLVVDGSYGSIQWQVYDSTAGWQNIASATNPSIDVNPTVNTAYRVLACGSATSDTLTLNIVSLQAPTVINNTTIVSCDSSGTDTLIATYPAAGIGFSWYDAATGGNLIQSGDTLLFTGTPSAGTPVRDTFYVSASTGGGGGSVGPIDNTIGASANYTAMNHYMLFTVHAPTTIESVDVIANGAGLVDVVIQDAATQTNLFTHTVAVPAGGLQTLTLNQPLPPGDYRMGGTTVNNAGGLQRNSTGGAYPYLSNDGSVEITGNTFNASYYYFFYNWQLAGGCEGPRAMVIGEVDCVVGIDDAESLANNFEVYPNPSNGLFTLNISTEKAERYHLSVRDVQGKLIYEEEISVNGAYREELDLKGLAKGVYYLQVQNDKASKVEKLIIQ